MTGLTIALAVVTGIRPAVFFFGIQTPLNSAIGLWFLPLAYNFHPSLPVLFPVPVSQVCLFLL